MERSNSYRRCFISDKMYSDWTKATGYWMMDAGLIVDERLFSTFTHSLFTITK